MTRREYLRLESLLSKYIADQRSLKLKLASDKSTVYDTLEYQDVRISWASNLLEDVSRVNFFASSEVQDALMGRYNLLYGPNSPLYRSGEIVK